MTDIEDVVAALQDGDLAIFPTETLWSLSANAFEPSSSAKVFAAKRRPDGVPLAVGFSSWGMARQYVQATPLAEALAAKYLPGPLSLILERADDHLAHVAPGLSTLSVRIPSHPLALAVLERAGPCIMTSANLHRGSDPISRADVNRLFPDIVTAGDEVPGTGSTIVDARGDKPSVIRQGIIQLDDDLLAGILPE